MDLVMTWSIFGMEYSKGPCKTRGSKMSKLEWEVGILQKNTHEILSLLKQGAGISNPSSVSDRVVSVEETASVV